MAFLFGFYCVREYSYLFRIFTPLPSVAAFAGNGDYANAQFPVSGERRGTVADDATWTTRRPGVSRSAKLG